MGKAKILLVQLEFERWAQAKTWSYLETFAFEEGFRANGLECVTLPAFDGVPDTSPLSWLHDAKRLLAGCRFEQVWIWFGSHRYSDAFLEWIADLAPIRVGVLMESVGLSVGSDEEDCVLWPPWRKRAYRLDHQLRQMTHVLTADERDAETINNAGFVKAAWWTPAVPARFVVPVREPPPRGGAVCVEVHDGAHDAWLPLPQLKDVRIRQPSAEPTDLPRLFDLLNRLTVERFRSGQRRDLVACTHYLGYLRRLRELIFASRLAGLRSCSAVVVLPRPSPSSVRVVEAMAAGRPVITWAAPDRPRTMALFRDGAEILLYPQDRPAVLAEHLARVTHDADYARAIAAAARAELLRSHTAEFRAWQLLDWIHSGAEPLARRSSDAGGEEGVLQKGSSAKGVGSLCRLGTKEGRAAAATA